MTQEWLILADGEPLSEKKLLFLAQNKQVLVLDGAYDIALQAGLNINVLLGDFDTISSHSLSKARLTTQVIHTPDQNKTDLAKGIEYIDQHEAGAAISIAAATGRRLQHTVHNLRLLKRYYKKTRPITLYSENEVISYYEDAEIILNGQAQDSIGLLGFPKATITTSGLKYDVTDYTMDFENKDSICNELASEKAVIKIQGGVLVIRESLLNDN